MRADLLARCRRAGRQQLGRRHQHAGRTEPALQRVARDEPLLQVGDLARLREPLDGYDLGAVGLHGEHQAAAHDRAVDPHRAGPAHAMLAAQVRAGEAEVGAQEVDEVLAHGNHARDALTVDGQADGQVLLVAHAALMLPWPARWPAPAPPPAHAASARAADAAASWRCPARSTSARGRRRAPRPPLPHCSRRAACP